MENQTFKTKNNGGNFDDLDDFCIPCMECEGKGKLEDNSDCELCFGHGKLVYITQDFFGDNPKLE